MSHRSTFGQWKIPGGVRVRDGGIVGLDSEETAYEEDSDYEVLGCGICPNAERAETVAVRKSIRRVEPLPTGLR